MNVATQKMIEQIEEIEERLEAVLDTCRPDQWSVITADGFLVDPETNKVAPASLAPWFSYHDAKAHANGRRTKSGPLRAIRRDRAIFEMIERGQQTIQQIMDAETNRSAA